MTTVEPSGANVLPRPMRTSMLMRRTMHRRARRLNRKLSAGRRASGRCGEARSGTRRSRRTHADRARRGVEERSCVLLHRVELVLELVARIGARRRAVLVEGRHFGLQPSNDDGKPARVLEGGAADVRIDVVGRCRKGQERDVRVAELDVRRARVEERGLRASELESARRGPAGFRTE